MNDQPEDDTQRQTCGQPAFAFSTKGPMALSTARGVAGMSGTTRFSAGLGGLGGDLSSALSTLRGGGLVNALRGTPANVAASLRSGDDFARLLQGESALSKSLDDIAQLGTFKALPGVGHSIDQALDLSAQANTWAKIGNISFGVNLVGAALDAADIDIPFIP